MWVASVHHLGGELPPRGWVGDDVDVVVVLLVVVPPIAGSGLRLRIRPHAVRAVVVVVLVVVPLVGRVFQNSSSV